MDVPALNSGDRAECGTACGMPAQVNISMQERKYSLIGGGLLILNALVGPRKTRPLSFLAGAALAYRGASGHCAAYQALQIDTSES